tara:strand:- start:15201 stop:18809 length:3609 start_codon:yes stop_codon:yes gene_type:complete
MAQDTKIAFEVEIKNVSEVSKLKDELKKLRKEQREIEKQTVKTGQASKKNAEQYTKTAKNIGDKSKRLRELNKNLREGTNATKKATKSSNAMAKQFLKGAAALGIIVGAFRTVSNSISSVIRTFTEFEFTMAKVLAVSGATEKEFQELTETAEELGRTTFFTAEQVGQLQLAFSKLGFTAAEIQNAVKPTLDLATATGTDLARAAQVAGASVRGFGLDAAETERVVDVMTVSFASSALDIEKWSTGMTKVAPIAKAAGFSIEDTAAIMAKLSDSGIEASIAGTSLRNILLKMQDPTSELSMRFGKTIHSLDDLVPAMKQFVAEGGSMADIMEVVDLRQAAAFEQMLTTADGTIALRNELRDANGEGARMAALVGDTLQGAFLKLKSALQGVSISLMKDFAGGMQKAVERAANFFNTIAENSKTITDTIKFLGKLIRVIALFRIGTIAQTKAIELYTKRLGLLRLAKIKLVPVTNLLTGGINRLAMSVKKLMARSGVGLLLAFLPEILNFFGLWKDETDEVTEATDSLTESQKQLDTVFKEANKESEETKVQFEQLIELKKEMNKMLDEEGNLLDDTETNQKVYNSLKGQAAILIRNLNDELKDNDQALINEKTSIDDLTVAMNNLTKSMMQQAIAEGFKDRMGTITSEAATARLALIELRKAVGENITNEDLADMEFDRLVGNVPNTDIAMRNSASLMLQTQKNFDATNERLKSIFEKYNVDFSQGIGETINNLIATSDDADDALAGLRQSYTELIDELGLDAMTVFGADTGGGDGGGGGGDETIVTDWAKKTKEALNIVKQQLLDNQLSEEGYRDAVLKSRGDILQEELKSLKPTATNAKRILEIKTQLLDIELQKRQNTINDELKLQQDKFNKEKEDIIANNTINGKLTQEGKELLLQLEVDFLNGKRQLYEDYAMNVMNLDTQIATSNRRLQEQQMQSFKEQVSEIGRLGSAIQGLAGDNEKLNFVKEAGIKISQIATTVEAALRVQESLRTLGILKQNAAKAADIVVTNTQTASNIKESVSENVSTTSTIAGTVADIASIIPKAISSILSSAMAIPFPFNIAAIIATMAIIRRVMRFKGEHGGVVDETFAQGGMVHGRSHAQGGEKFAVGGRVVELEGGEAVINKRSTAMFRGQLSAMNEAGGGVRFADGGLLNMPSFAQQKFNAGSVNTNSQRVFVVESDITTTQQTVQTLEAEATI